MSDLTRRLTETAETLGRRLDSVFAGLSRLSVQAAEKLQHPEVVRGSLGGLRAEVDALIDASGGLVDSAGVSTVPGVLRDAEMWHQWWSLLGGQLVFIPHNLNPASLNYYDYAEMMWFDRPLVSGQAEIVGPYLDFGGADMVVVTASRPVAVRDRTLAIAGADLSMHEIERQFLTTLGRRDEHVALVTATGKVVASNTARFAPGTRFTAPKSAVEPVSVPVPVDDLAHDPWHVVAVGAPASAH